MYKKSVFEKFTLNGDRTRIRKVTFTTAVGDALLTIDCAAVFWFDQKYISKVNWFSKYFVLDLRIAHISKCFIFN